MKRSNDRRTFIRDAALAGIGLGFANTATSNNGSGQPQQSPQKILNEGRVGIIGLDTSHSIAFTESLNASTPKPGLLGFKVVAAYPYGSRDIPSSSERIPEYTERIKKMGVEVVDSLDALLKKVDVVLLETNDGRLHLDQAIQVMKTGKRMFIDKPIAHSLADAIKIFDAAKKYNVPVFSSSSLRYSPGLDAIRSGSAIGKVLGADSYSPCTIEKTHGDLFWYGIHGVETLFTVMGTGCKQVSRMHTDGIDVVMGTWDDNRIGTFRGIRNGQTGYGGSAFGEKGIVPLPPYSGYDPLLVQVVHFFRTGVAPVSAEETLELCAFMEAADESKKKGGVVVTIDSVMKKARGNA